MRLLLLAPLHLFAASRLYAVLLWLGTASLLWNLVSMLLLPLLPRAFGQRVGRAAISLGYRQLWFVARAVGVLQLDSSALDALRNEPGGMIIAANHPSMLDALLIVSRLPRGVCVMKAALMGNVFLGAGARLARYIRNDSPRELVIRAISTLRDGGQVVLFPEGTRTEQRPLNALLPGMTLIAWRAGVPIQTVLIDTPSPYLGKGWPMWRLPPLPIVFRMRLGERFVACEDHQATRIQLEDYFRKELGT